MGRQKNASQVLVGRVVGPAGLRGEVRIAALSDVPERFAPGSKLSIDGSPAQVLYSRPTAKGLLIKLSGVESRNDAEALRGKELHVTERDTPPPPEDTYYFFQVLGMRVVTVEGEEVGEVTDILTTGANDVYVVTRQGKETLVPALADVVVKVDVQGKGMTVNLPEGL